jgi:stage III sporulation protein AE
MMKRKVLVLFVAFVLFFLLGTKANAKEEIKEKSISEFIDILPSEARDEIEAPLLENRVLEIISPEFLLNAALSAFYGECGRVGEVFFTLLALTLFFAVASLLRAGIVSESAAKISENALMLISALLVYSLLSSSLTRVYSFIDDIKSFENGLVPIMTALYLSGGNTATAVSSGAGVGAALLVIDNLCAQTLPALVKISFALTLINSLGSEISYTPLIKMLKNVYMSVLGFASMVLSASIAFGTAISSSADSVAARTVRYAISNMLPIVGGTVSASYGTLAASLSVIKSTLGASSIVALLLLFLPMIIYLLLIRLSLNLSASFSEMLGYPKIGKLYGDFRAVYDLALSATVFCSLIFFIIVSVFLKCSWAVA